MNEFFDTSVLIAARPVFVIPSGARDLLCLL
jgi:hypothetical protein